MQIRSYLTFREYHRFRVSENRALRRIFDPQDRERNGSKIAKWEVS
jgi:hypothetical protein